MTNLKSEVVFFDRLIICIMRPSVAEVLTEVCALFDYNAAYVTLFWQPHSVWTRGDG